MNKVVLMGRLTRDPYISYSQGERQMAIARYTLAVDRRMRRTGNPGEQTADFISCVAFDRAAEFAEKYLRQGTRIAVSGRIQTGSYTNREGQKVYTTDVIVEEQEFAESKAASQASAGAGAGFGAPGSGMDRGNTDFGQPLPSMPKPDPGSAIGDGFMNIPDGVDDEGLPFN